MRWSWTCLSWRLMLHAKHQLNQQLTQLHVTGIFCVIVAIIMIILQPLFLKKNQCQISLIQIKVFPVSTINGRLICCWLKPVIELSRWPKLNFTLACSYFSPQGRVCTLICVVSLVYFSFTLHRWLIIFKPGCQLLSGFHKSSIECKILRGTIQGATVHVTVSAAVSLFFLSYEMVK